MAFVNFTALARPSFTLFAAAVLLCWAVTLGIRFLANKLAIFAKRDLRRRHKRNVPLLGGSGFFIVVVSLVTIFWLFPQVIDGTPLTSRFAICFLGAVSLVFVVGACDDFFELTAGPKFAAQVFAGLLMIMADPEVPALIRQVPVPHALHLIAFLVWVVGITNAINMIDGLDGLCTGVVGIAAITVAAMIGLRGGSPDFIRALPIVLTGAAVGFLIHNFFPARIFLGDSGSTLLGLLISVLTVRIPAPESPFLGPTLPLMILGLPLMDMFMAIIRRFRMRRPVFQGDRNHIHHQLQRLGLPHRMVVVILWGWALYFCLIAFGASRTPGIFALAPFILGIPAILSWVMSLQFFKRRLSFQIEQYSRLFLRQGSKLFGTDETLVTFLGDEILRAKANGSAFTVLILEVNELFHEIAGERAERSIEFQMTLLSTFRTRLRENDHVARIAGNRIAAVVVGVDGHSTESDVVGFLNSKTREVQEAFGIYQTHPDRAESLKIWVYPKDSRKINALLALEKSEKAHHLKVA